MVRRLINARSKSVLICSMLLAGFVIFSITLSYAQTNTDPKGFKFYNPYKRLKNGPTLKNVTWKVNSSWISGWIKDTKVYDPGARMPFLMLEEDEVKAIIAYLASIADKTSPNPKIQWDSFLSKSDDELSDEEFEVVDELMAKGQGVWSNSRCGLCHGQKGIGGFVPVAPDLGKLQLKISNRDWLHFWISNPRDHFLDTMMPQFKIPEDELKALIEYILRSEDFAPEFEDEEDEGEEEEDEEEEAAVVQTFSPMDAVYSKDSALIAEGKRLVTISRCVVCHDIEGITEVLPKPVRDPVPTEGFPKLVYEKRCLTCHNIGGEGGTYAPPWDPVGSKLKADWIADFLQKPNIIRPILQQMPKLGITEEEAKSAVDFIESNFTMPPFGITEEEAQTAKDYIKKSFVIGDVPTDLFSGGVDEGRAGKGKKFYDGYGCNACHAIGPVGGVIGPALTNAGDRLEPNWMFWHLKDSRHAMLDTVEPRFDFTDDEITNLVHFLMSCTEKGTS